MTIAEQSAAMHIRSRRHVACVSSKTIAAGESIQPFLLALTSLKTFLAFVMRSACFVRPHIDKHKSCNYCSTADLPKRKPLQYWAFQWRQLSWIDVKLRLFSSFT